MPLSTGFFRRRIDSGLRRGPAEVSVRFDSSAAQAVGPAALEETAELAGIWGIAEDREFIQEAYRLILRRPCDLSGFVNCAEMLRNHVPRRVVVLQLINSAEAAARGVRFTGIPNARTGPSDRKWLSLSIRSLLGRPVALAQNVVRRLFYLPLESLGGRLTLFMDAMASKLDRLSEKGDQNLWTLGEKIDRSAISHVEAKREIIDSILAELTAGSESAGLNTRLLINGAVERIEASLAEMAAADLERFGSLRAEIDRVSRKQNEFDRLSAGISQLARAIGARFDEMDTRLASLERAASLDREPLGPRMAAVLRRILPAMPEDVLVEEVDGFIVGVPREEWRIAAFHKFRGVLEPGTARVFRDLIMPGMTVIDVGANIGMFTLYACRGLQGKGRVHSFEPTPRIFELLRENVQVNGYLETGMVEFHRSAVMDRAGTVRLTMFPKNCGHNTLFGEGTEGAELDVATVALDEALPAETVADVVKIDAEGAEPFVLRGMKQLIARSPRIVVIIEFAPANISRAGVEPRAFLEEIAADGFSVTAIDEDTGSCRGAGPDELLSRSSINLCLTRVQRPEGLP